jgi:hypothetical protein
MTLAHPQGIGEVSFTWQADRFQHLVVLGAARVAEVQDETDTSWPKSPPLQDLSIESIEGRDVALGVGRAGTSHWSVSVEPVTDGFRFEWACRSKEVPRHLGSAYQLDGSGRISAAEDSLLSDAGDHVEVKPAAELVAAQTYRWSYTITTSP